MWEGDIDAAWQAAQHSGCSRPLWLELARTRAEQHPADAMPILRDLALRYDIHGTHRRIVPRLVTADRSRMASARQWTEVRSGVVGRKKHGPPGSMPHGFRRESERSSHN